MGRRIKESLEVLLMGPREWGPIFRIPSLWKVEALYWVYYLFRFIPLDIMLETRGQERPYRDFRFGDTPWFTAQEILKEAEVGPQDRLFDLGSGRGKVVFLGALACGCEATGVELLPTYVRIGRKIARRVGCASVSFLQRDFLAVDISSATVVYACAAAMSEETLEDLLLLVDQLEIGTRWISVGWQSRSPRLQKVAEKEYLFSWGREIVYFYRVIEAPVVEFIVPQEDDEDEFYEESRPDHPADSDGGPALTGHLRRLESYP